MPNETDNRSVRPQLLLFDVYETLLSMESVRKTLNQILDSKRGYTIWFEILTQNFLLQNAINQFHDFATIADASLQMTHQLLGQSQRQGEFSSVLESMKHLPLQENVQEGLSAIFDMGYRIAAFTNSPERIVIERMERTGLISYFEAVLSAEKIKIYKPATSSYLWVAEKLQVSPGEIMVVSAHPWDIAGATNAGMQVAYLHRGKQLFNPLIQLPTFDWRACYNWQHIWKNLANKTHSKKV